MSFNKDLHPKNYWIATLLAFSLVPLSGIATDIYIPSLPRMSSDLHATASQIRLTISLFLVSYGVSQFAAGAVIDALGRYRPAFWTILVFSLSNILIYFSDSINLILAVRVVQGICAGVIAASKRTILVDIYEGERRRHYLSMMSIVWSIGPIVAPFIGGYLDHMSGWRSCFLFLGIYCLIVLVMEYIYSGETIRSYHPLNLKSILDKSRVVLKDAKFSYGILVLAFCYGMVILYGLVSPFIIEHTFGFSTVMTGYFALFMGFAWMIGGFIGRALIAKPFFTKLRNANLLQLLFAVGMVFSFAACHNMYTLIAFAFVIHVGAGFIFNNYFAFCLGRFPEMAGLSGGLAGGMNYILCSAFSYGIVQFVNPVSQYGLGICYLIFSACLSALLFLVPKRDSR